MKDFSFKILENWEDFFELSRFVFKHLTDYYGVDFCIECQSPNGLKFFLTINTDLEAGSNFDNLEDAIKYVEEYRDQINNVSLKYVGHGADFSYEYNIDISPDLNSINIRLNYFKDSIGD